MISFGLSHLSTKSDRGSEYEGDDNDNERRMMLEIVVVRTVVDDR